MNYGLSEGVVQAAALVLGCDPGSVRLHNGPVAVVTHQSEPGSEVVVEGGQFHVDWPQPMPPADDPAAVDEYIDAPHPHSGILHCGTVRSGGGAFMVRPRSHHAVMDALRYAITSSMLAIFVVCGSSTLADLCWYETCAGQTTLKSCSFSLCVASTLLPARTPKLSSPRGASGPGLLFARGAARATIGGSGRGRLSCVLPPISAARPQRVLDGRAPPCALRTLLPCFGE